MKMMEGVLKEELERLRALEKSYLGEIRKLPKGSLQEKEIKDHSYFYHVSSTNSVVNSRYVGPPGEEKVKKLKEAIALRKKYEGLLQEVRINIGRIEKILRGRQRSV